MAVSAHVYSKLPKSLSDKLCDLDSDALKVMLLSAYTPAQDVHQFVSDVKAAGTETTGTGYTAGGQALTSVTFALAGHVYTLGCANPSWDATGGSLAAAFAVFYDSTPSTDATRPVLCYWDFGGTQTATNGAFPLAVSSSGLLTFTGA